MSQPLLDGQDVFGVAVECRHSHPPRDVMRREYPNPLSMPEELDMVHQIPTTTITGRILGTSPADVGSRILSLRAFDDGSTHTLTDAEGKVWPACKFHGLQLDGRGVLAGAAGYSRRYAMHLRHLAT